MCVRRHSENSQSERADIEGWLYCNIPHSLSPYGGPGSSVGTIATGYGLDGPGIESRLGGARFSAPVQTGPGTHPASCTMGTRSFRAVKSGRGVTLTPHPLLVPWSRNSRAIPLLPLWAVRPVQSLSGCTRVHFTFYLIQGDSVARGPKLLSIKNYVIEIMTWKFI